MKEENLLARIERALKDPKIVPEAKERLEQARLTVLINERED
jgi:hypothetical protein